MLSAVKAALLKEEEEKRVLEEMDEDEYDALPDDAKEEIDRYRLEVKKEKKRRKEEEEEQAERERIEIEKMAAESQQAEGSKGKKGKNKRDETGKRSISGKTPLYIFISAYFMIQNTFSTYFC